RSSDLECCNIFYSDRAQEEQIKRVVRYEGSAGDHNSIDSGRGAHHPTARYVEFVIGYQVICEKKYDRTREKSQYINRDELVTAKVFNKKPTEPVKDQHVEQDVEDAA